MGERIRVAIAGINGKMGQASAKAILADKELQLVGGFGKAGASYVGKDLAGFAGGAETGILVSNGISDVLAGCRPQVILDFTQAEAAIDNAKTALGQGVRPVIGTSGISEAHRSELAELAAKHRTGAMVVPNFSVGAVLMMEFAKQAAEHYKNVEIVEMHHTKKLDAPSGTAMYTAGKLASVGSKYNPREVEDTELVKGARGGRLDSGVHVHSLRLPGLISHQEVIFGAQGELLTIRHDSFNTDCFMKGILLALRAVMNLDKLVVGLEHLLVAGSQA